MDLTSLRINADRMRADFDELAVIGATGDGGVHRPSLGPAHLQARAWLRDRIARDGLGFRTDGAGNHSAWLSCGPASPQRPATNSLTPYPPNFLTSKPETS